MGANQRFKTVIAFIAISLIIWLSSKVSKKTQDKQGYLTLSSKNPDLWSIQTINDLIEQESDDFKLRRFEKMENFLEALFLVTLSDPQAIENIDQELRTKDSSIQIIFANTGESL